MEKSQELIGILQAFSIVAKSLAAKLMRKKVFICSPFRGDMEGNARKAAEIAYATTQGKEVIFKETEGM